MKKFLLAIALMAASPNALALKATDDGYAWINATPKERAELSKQIVKTLGASYPYTGIQSCLDAFYAKPVISQVHSQKIDDMAKLCHIQIK